jgi:predicted DCC family thiol-disulfide oxidoreductase YuxK
VWLFASSRDAVVSYSTYRLGLLRIALGGYALLVLLLLPRATPPLLPEFAADWADLPGALRGALRLVGVAGALSLMLGWGRRTVALVLVPILGLLGAYGRLSVPVVGSLSLLLVLLAAQPADDVLQLRPPRLVQPPAADPVSLWFRAAWLLGVVAAFALPMYGGSTATVCVSLVGLAVSLRAFLRGPELNVGRVLLGAAVVAAFTAPEPLALLGLLPLWALALFDEAWVPPVADEAPILFFDGLCVLCNRVVQLILLEEQKPILRFASLDSEVARVRLAGPAERVDSIVLYSHGRCHLRSEAALLTARAMGGLWGVLWIFRAVPRAFRDAVYDFIAANRYGWFGRLDACPIPTQQQRERFVD